mmetsp:Transcript_2184/g.2557  ORF Transcript_2184/g.2557 Transcript_2184/m.2557 type:complete len:91 (-) Transcript_2184:223-495(-)
MNEYGGRCGTMSLTLTKRLVVGTLLLYIAAKLCDPTFGHPKVVQAIPFGLNLNEILNAVKTASPPPRECPVHKTTRFGLSASKFFTKEQT